MRVKNPAELAAAWADLKSVPCVLEKMLPLHMECSVIVARGADGHCVNLPVQRNLHRDGILAVTEVYEGNMPLAQAERAVAAAKSIASGLQYVGVLCVEFFVLDPAQPEAQALGGLVVNEMAPRPHNSGHYSMDACDAICRTKRASIATTPTALSRCSHSEWTASNAPDSDPVPSASVNSNTERSRVSATSSFDIVGSNRPIASKQSELIQRHGDARQVGADSVEQSGDRGAVDADAAGRSFSPHPRSQLARRCEHMQPTFFT